ncbi:hypothetical protein LOH54_11760 [Sulfurimonas sp. HSL-3221]|uniref:hypothetical protein n=1 Tax=Sulfurimonadaceae TaxID=2771471 RepID=UPI001E56884D|nr:hypothetical protein [Sulfurimonas sp. HSL-3221]UFS62314.1 hypothetical protein LOH54_11760 [Sulfurimonas sp. HSL-3221]
MNTVSVIETLKQIGIADLSMRTHISTDNMQKLLAGDFDAFSAIQFNGFVTIIEREFDVDLTEWRQQFAASGPAPLEPLAASEEDPFANVAKSKKRQRLTVAALVAALLAVIIVTYLVLGTGGKTEKFELNNTAIDQARATMAAMNTTTAPSTLAEADAIQEAHQNIAAEPNATVAEENASVAAAEAVPVENSVYEDVILRPISTSIWLGVIDAKTHKRSVYTTEEPVRLDGTKAWLIVTGHGYFSLDCGGKELHFKQSERVLLEYNEGVCRELDETEFRARNKGQVW